jgi:hypothetical protein
VFHVASAGMNSPHDKIASAIQNKLYILSKYNRNAVAPLLEVLRYWRLDRETGRWATTSARRSQPIDDILAETWAWASRVF